VDARPMRWCDVVSKPHVALMPVVVSAPHVSGGWREEALLGGVAAGCAAMLTNPLDVARVRLQLRRDATCHSGPLRVMARVARDEGPAALTKGLGFSLAYNAVLNSTRFAAFHALSDAHELGLPAPVAGVLAGSVAGALSSPLAKARTLQQRAADTNVSPLRALITAPFHGSLSWAVRNGGHTGIIFSAYAVCKRAATDAFPSMPAPAIHVAASLQAAVLSCIIMNPVDTVATRMYNATVGVHSSVGVPARYASALDCFAITVAEEGYRALYRGLLANIMRVVPHTVLTFTLMELLRSQLRRSEHGRDGGGTLPRAVTLACGQHGLAFAEQRVALPSIAVCADPFDFQPVE